MELVSFFGRTGDGKQQPAEPIVRNWNEQRLTLLHIPFDVCRAAEIQTINSLRDALSRIR